MSNAQKVEIYSAVSAQEGPCEAKLVEKTKLNVPPMAAFPTFSTGISVEC